MTNALLVHNPGLMSTIQDAGRFGYQRFGVSASGPMDGVNFTLANTLAGNPPGTEAIEMTALGGTYEVDAETCLIAVAGAEMPITIDGAPAERYRSYRLSRGAKIVIGQARKGLRAYLAVHGGFPGLPPQLGSRATHTRTGLGGLDGKPLAQNQALDLAEVEALPGERFLPEHLWPDPAGDIRVLLGPQDDYFTAEGLETFLSSSYRVTQQSDRMGMQLEGPVIEHDPAKGFNIVSDGIATGSIQVPGAGKPIILLADRQTTGGYPKIATVFSGDLWRLAQREPGAELRFTAITLQEATQARRREEDWRAKLCDALEPVVDPTRLLASERLLSLNLIDGVVSAEPAA